MARITLGIGTSHSPMLSLSPKYWPTWAARDAARSDLNNPPGVCVSYETLLNRAPQSLRAELEPDVMAAKSARCAQALDQLKARLAAADLDAVIVFGDDQLEHLHSDNLPAVLIYHGESILNTRACADEAARPEERERIAGYHEPDGDVAYPVARELAEHLIDFLLDKHFDVASSNRLPQSRAEGHALQFPHRRLLGSDLPIVPILINTYVPPTQPRAARCYDLGVAIANAVQSFGSAHGRPARVGVLASGGLSHFVVHEEFDRMLLRAFSNADESCLRQLPETQLQSGSSEVKCWIAAAGACRELRFQTVDYVAGYRTAAGTGVGLAFGVWDR